VDRGRSPDMDGWKRDELDGWICIAWRWGLRMRKEYSGVQGLNRGLENRIEPKDFTRLLHTVMMIFPYLLSILQIRSVLLLEHT
jgi:hypothetical protein